MQSLFVHFAVYTVYCVYCFLKNNITMDFFLVEIKCVLPELAEGLCIVENMKMEHLGKKTFKLVKFMLNKVLYFIKSK